jgi:predicted RNA-binding protein
MAEHLLDSYLLAGQRRRAFVTYWIVVGSEENFRIAADRGFDMFGFKSTRRKGSAEMQPGDRLVFYLTGIMKLGGIARVESQQFEDHTPVFRTEKKPGEDYPYRVKTAPEIILDPSLYLDVKELAPLLEFTRSRGEHWRLAFQGNLHKIEKQDFDIIEREMKVRTPVGA